MHETAQTPAKRYLALSGGVGGAKLVGISQRRRRQGARFQYMVHTAWNPERLVGVLRHPRPEVGDLPEVATLAPAVAAALPAALVDTLNA